MGNAVPHLHDQLMGAGHQSEAVGVVEGFRDVLSEGVAGTSGGNAPPTAVIGVRPQQVTHGALKATQTETKRQRGRELSQEKDEEQIRDEQVCEVCGV